MEKYLKGFKIKIIFLEEKADFFKNIFLEIPLDYTIYDLVKILEFIFDTKEIKNYKIKNLNFNKNTFENTKIIDFFGGDFIFIENGNLKFKMKFESFLKKVNHPKILKESELTDFSKINYNLRNYFRNIYKISLNSDNQNTEKFLLKRKSIKIKKVNGKEFEKINKKNTFSKIFRKIKSLIFKN